jgi:polygalacturonase
VYALSVDGLKFKGNTINRSNLFTPWHHNKQTFTIDGCKNVTITSNIIGDDVLGKNVLLKRMGIENLTLQKELKITK